MAFYRDPPDDPGGDPVVVATPEELHELRPAILGCLRRFRVPPNDVEDLGQEVNIIAWRALERGRVRGSRTIEPRHALLGFVFTTARFVVANQRRRWSTRLERLCERSGPELVADPWDGRDLVAQLEARDLLRRMPGGGGHLVGDGKVSHRSECERYLRAALMEPFLAMLGQRVRSLRQAQGMSLAELEAESGVRKGSLSLIERAKINVTVWTCLRIARALDVEVIDLFREWSDS